MRRRHDCQCVVRSCVVQWCPSAHLAPGPGSGRAAERAPPQQPPPATRRPPQPRPQPGQRRPCHKRSPCPSGRPRRWSQSRGPSERSGTHTAPCAVRCSRERARRPRQRRAAEAESRTRYADPLRAACPVASPRRRAEGASGSCGPRALQTSSLEVRPPPKGGPQPRDIATARCDRGRGSAAPLCRRNPPVTLTLILCVTGRPIGRAREPHAAHKRSAAVERCARPRNSCMIRRLVAANAPGAKSARTPHCRTACAAADGSAARHVRRARHGLRVICTMRAVWSPDNRD